MSEKKIPQKNPYVLEVSPGTYAWCACGRSANQPYCDGSHKGSGFNPVIEQVEVERTVAWCGCKHTSSAPFCDGTHRKL